METTTNPDCGSGAELGTGPGRVGSTWPCWLRTILRILGWTIAVAAVPVGLAISYLASFLGNCKLGFFGDYGPLPGAERFELWDFFGPLIGLAMATVPWLIIWRRARHPQARTAGWVLASICIFIVVAFIYMPQLGNAEIHWSGTCN